MRILPIGMLVKISSDSRFFNQHDGYGQIDRVYHVKDITWYDVSWHDGYSNSYRDQDLDSKIEDNQDAINCLPLFSLYE